MTSRKRVSISVGFATARASARTRSVARRSPVCSTLLNSTSKRNMHAPKQCSVGSGMTVQTWPGVVNLWREGVDEVGWERCPLLSVANGLRRAVDRALEGGRRALEMSRVDVGGEEGHRGMRADRPCDEEVYFEGELVERCYFGG